MANPIPLKVKFKSANLDDFIERYSVDMSRAGIFIRSKKTVPVGTLVRFEFTLQDESALLTGEGAVAWNREPDESRPAGGSPGIGIRFEKLPIASQEALERIVAAKSARPDAAVESRYDLGLRVFSAAAPSDSEDTETRTPIPSPAPGLTRPVPTDFHDEPATRVMQDDQARRLVEASRRGVAGSTAAPTPPPVSPASPAPEVRHPEPTLAAPEVVEPAPLPPPPMTAALEPSPGSEPIVAPAPTATDAPAAAAVTAESAHPASVASLAVESPPPATFIAAAASQIAGAASSSPPPSVVSAVELASVGEPALATSAVDAGSAHEAAASASAPANPANPGNPANIDRETTLPPLTQLPDVVASSLRLPAEELPAPPPIETELPAAPAPAPATATAPPTLAETVAAALPPEPSEPTAPSLEERPAAAMSPRPEVKAPRPEPEPRSASAETSPASPATPAAPSKPTGKRRSPVLTIAAAAVVLAGSAIVFFPGLFSSTSAPESPKPTPVTAPALPPSAPTPVPAQEPAPAPAPSGSNLEVLIDSEPAGASAVVDGKPVGVTPIRVPAVVGKSYEVFFALKGYQGSRQSLVAKPGVIARVKLVEAAHFVDVTSTPANAEVFVNGKAAGKTGSKPLHVRLPAVAQGVKLTVSHKGFATDERTLSLTQPFETHPEGEVLPLAVALNSGNAAAAASTDPAGKPLKKGRHRRRAGAN